MPYDPAVHDRRSMRLRTYDYSRIGRYFVTIDIHQMRCLFGHVSEGQMHANDAGHMVEKWMSKLAVKFPGLQVDSSVVMPNHIHVIVYVTEQAHTSLEDVTGWLKTMTTNEYIRQVKASGWTRFDGRLWQRNYYDHIIRDGESLDAIRRYIAENPARWESDRANPECKNRREPTNWMDTM